MFLGLHRSVQASLLLNKSSHRFAVRDEPDNLPDDTGIIHTASIEKGGWVYEEFSLDEPFDHKKLKFYLYQIDGLFVVDHMQYEDIEIDQIDGSTIGKDFQVWFDDQT